MIRPLTIALVLVAGMAVALVMTGRDRVERRALGLLESITADDGFVRRAAWETMSRDTDDARRAAITTRLAEPGLDRGVLADAARGCLDLGWPIEPDHAIAAGELGDADAFLAWFVPTLAADGAVPATAAPAIRAVAATDRRPADELMTALVAFAGSPPDPTRVTQLATILDDPASPPTDRIRLTLGRLGAAPRGSTLDLDPVGAVRTLLADPETDTVAVLDAAPVWALARTGAAARSHLTTRAAEGDADATRALGLADPDRVTAVARATFDDPASDHDRRTLAAFRLLDHDVALGDATILELLDAGPADGDGTVHAAALLAWRGLSEDSRTAILKRWLDSDDLDRRRAGVMLAAVQRAMTGEDPDPSVTATIDRLAVDPGTEARLRRTARLATRVLDRWPHDDVDASAYAARTTRLDDGRLDADTVLLGVLAGDADASRRLTASPRTAPLPDPERAAAFARDVAWRRAIVSSIAPERFRTVGEPIPGDENDLRLWIDALAAERLVAGPFMPDPESIADSIPSDEIPRP